MGESHDICLEREGEEERKGEERRGGGGKGGERRGGEEEEEMRDGCLHLMPEESESCHSNLAHLVRGRRAVSEWVMGDNVSA